MYWFEIRLAAAGSALVFGLILAIFNAANLWAGAGYVVGGVLVSGWFLFGCKFEDMISRTLLVGAASIFGLLAFYHEIANPEFSPELRKESHAYWVGLKTNRRSYGQGFDRGVLNKFEEEYLRFCFVEHYSVASIQMMNAYKSLALPAEMSLLDVTELGAEEKKSRCMTSIEQFASNAPDWFETVYPEMSRTVTSKG